MAGGSVCDWRIAGDWGACAEGDDCGSGGAEFEGADCGALLLGAEFVNYTGFGDWGIAVEDWAEDSIFCCGGDWGGGDDFVCWDGGGEACELSVDLRWRSQVGIQI